jgi:hypothetical protein
MGFNRRSILKGSGAALSVSVLSVAGAAEESDTEKLNEFEETFTVGPSAAYFDSVAIDYEPVEGATEITATLTWNTAPAQDVDLILYDGSGEEVTGSRRTNPPAAEESIETPIDEGTTYSIEASGWVTAQAECTLTVVERGIPPEDA